MGADKHEMLRHLVRHFKMASLTLDVPNRPNAMSREFGRDKGAVFDMEVYIRAR